MTAKELMIGDWVMVYPWDETPWEPKKITDINFHSWEGTDFCDSVGVEGWDELSLDEIKPIPLTTEILEKNEIDTVFKTKYKWFYLEYHAEAGMIVLYVYNNGSFQPTGICFKYVHQLQHALRLCGIEKEIEL